MAAFFVGDLYLAHDQSQKNFGRGRQIPETGINRVNKSLLGEKQM